MRLLVRVNIIISYFHEKLYVCKTLFENTYIDWHYSADIYKLKWIINNVYNELNWHGISFKRDFIKIKQYVLYNHSDITIR